MSGCIFLNGVVFFSFEFKWFVMIIMFCFWNVNFVVNGLCVFLNNGFLFLIWIIFLLSNFGIGVNFMCDGL